MTRPLTEISTQLPATIGTAHRSAAGRCEFVGGIGQSVVGVNYDSIVLANALKAEFLNELVELETASVVVGYSLF